MPEEITAQIDAVLQELYAKRNEIDVSISTMLMLKGSGSIVVPEAANGGGAAAIRSGGGVGIASNAFFSMSLVDAAKKCIEIKQARLTLQDIVTGLEQGGMPGQKPNTVYAALRRRESTVGDITRVDDLWGLKEWSAGISVASTSKVAKSKKGKKGTKRGAKKAAKKATKSASTETAKPKLVVVEAPPEDSSKAGKSTTIRDAAFEMLSKEGAPLHAKVLAERINKGYGKTTSEKSLAASLKDDGKQRFDTIGHNTWVIDEWPDEKKKLTVASATA